MLQSFHFHFPCVIHLLCCVQVDDTPPLVRRSGRPIELLPSGPISLIGNNAPSFAAIMHRGVRLKKVTTKTSPSVAATALAQAFKVNFYTNPILIPITLVLINFSLLYQHTGTSAKTRSTTADAPQSSQPKRKGPKSTRSQAKHQRTTTPPPPPRSLIPVESSPSSPEAQTQQVSSPPQPQEELQIEDLQLEEPQPEEPQPEETLADVHEQTADLASLIIASVVSSIQTSPAPPRGNILSIYCR